MNAADLYLDLLKKCLTRYIWEDTLVPYNPQEWGGALKTKLKANMASFLGERGVELYKRVPFDREARELGRDWPVGAETMIGLKRLDNLQYCIRTIINEAIPGDFIETGVWRGGASIFMRAALEAYQDKEKKVWCADSFEGLPEPDEINYPADRIATWHTADELAIPQEVVKQNFEKYGLLDDRVKFLKGWFKDTLPVAPIDQLSLIRLDGDMYESTMDGLNNLYHKLVPGGFLIIDDYGLPEDTCRKAIHDFRAAHEITEPIIDIDGYGAYWRRAVA
jgi:O-methyltransferase